MMKYPFSIIQTKQAFIVVADNGDQAWFYSRKKMAEYIADNFIFEKNPDEKPLLSKVDDLNKTIRRAYFKRRFER